MTSPSPTLDNAAARKTPAVLRIAAVVYAAVAVFDVVAHPLTEGHKHFTAADYIFTALLIPFVLAALATVVVMHRLHMGRDGRLGRVGFVVAAVGLIAFLPGGVVPLLTNDTSSTGPLYPLATLVSLIGIGMRGCAVYRARVLPGWVGPALVLGWIFGGPVAEGGTPGFRGAGMIQAAIYLIMAAVIAKAVSATAAANPNRQQQSFVASR